MEGFYYTDDKEVMKSVVEAREMLHDKMASGNARRGELTKLLFEQMLRGIYYTGTHFN